MDLHAGCRDVGFTDAVHGARIPAIVAVSHGTCGSPFVHRGLAEQLDVPPSQEPPGFDRAAFQRALHAEILAFLRRALTRGATDAP
jgi:hypothetical protein